MDLPALGFGMGDVVLGELLKDAQRVPPQAAKLDALLVAVSGEDVPFVLRLAHDLRDEGYAVEYSLKHRAVRHQLELGAARGAGCAIIVGPDERRDGMVVLKSLNGGTERRVKLESLAEELR